MLARLEQVLDISTSVVVGKNKYDLEKMMKNEKEKWLCRASGKVASLVISRWQMFRMMLRNLNES